MICCHIEKHHTTAALGTSYAHNVRKAFSENVDRDKRSENIELVHRDLSYNEYFDKRRHEIADEFFKGELQKVRSNAVRMVEMVISPGSFIEIKNNPVFDAREFGRLAREWAIERFGEANIAGMHLHMDEQTPHIHLAVVPYTQDGRLSARDAIGGPAELKALQTSLADKLASLGLVRGKEGRSALRKEVRQFYADVTDAQRAQLPAPEEGEDIRSYYMRATGAFRARISQEKALSYELQEKYLDMAHKVSELEASNENVVDEEKEEIRRALKQAKERIALLEKQLEEQKDIMRIWNNLGKALNSGFMTQEDVSTLQELMNKAFDIGEEIGDKQADIDTDPDNRD